MHNKYNIIKISTNNFNTYYFHKPLINEKINKYYKRTYTEIILEINI